MDTQTVLSSIFSGVKPLLPFLIFIIIINFIIVFFKRSRRDASKSKNKLFANNDFKVMNLLNNEEIIVYEALLKHIQEASQNTYKVFAQVGMAGILQNSDQSSFGRIKQQRADFCITDKSYTPIAIIEYNGGGHFQGNYKERDTVKQASTEYAGMVFHAITEKDYKDIENHIKNTIIPLLKNKEKQSKEVRNILRTQRIEPKF